MSNLRNIGYKIFLLANKVENGKENLCKMLNKNNDAYSKMVHCMSNFEKNENCDEILDIIDTYIDFKEAYESIK